MAKVKRKGPPKSKDDPRLAQYLADPALRSRLADSLLTPALRAQRERNNDPYYAPVQRMVQQRYREPEAQLTQAISDSGDQSRRVSDWFSQYQRALQESQARQQQVQQQAFGNVAGMAASLAQMQQASNQADPGVQASPELAKTATDANLLRNALGNTSAAALNQQGVNNNQAFEGLIASSVGSRAGALQDEAKRKSSLEDQLRRLVAEKSDYKVEARQGLEADAYKRALEAQAFGLDQAKLEAQVRDQEQRRIVSRRQVAAQEKNAETNRYRATHPKPPKKPKPTSGLGSRTKADESKLIGAINEGAKAIQSGSMTRKSLASRGSGSPEQNRVLANAANDMAKLGYLSPANVRALRRIGVHVAGFPRSKEQARKQGTLPSQKVGEALEGIGKAVIGLPTKPKADG